jgi:hypothetical protein
MLICFKLFSYDVDYDEPRKQKFETVSGGWGGNVNDIAFLKGFFFHFIIVTCLV